LPNLEDFKEQIVNQSISKKWSNKTTWLFHKLREEIHELEEQILLDSTNEEKVAKEVADSIIVLTQIHAKFASSKNMDDELQAKIDDNWKNKKKTLGDGKIERK